MLTDPCFQKKRLSIVQPGKVQEAIKDHSQSLTSLPTSPSSMNYSSSASYQLNNSLTSMNVSGNGLQNSTGSVCSSKSHSPAGSVASTLTLTGKVEQSGTSLSGSECGDTDRTKVTALTRIFKSTLIVVCFRRNQFSIIQPQI